MTASIDEDLGKIVIDTKPKRPTFEGEEGALGHGRYLATILLAMHELRAGRFSVPWYLQDAVIRPDVLNDLVIRAKDIAYNLSGDEGETQEYLRLAKLLQVAQAVPQVYLNLCVDTSTINIGGENRKFVTRLWLLKYSGTGKNDHLNSLALELFLERFQSDLNLLMVYVDENTLDLPAIVAEKWQSDREQSPMIFYFDKDTNVERLSLQMAEATWAAQNSQLPQVGNSEES